jgi:hypothetical protein
MKTLRYFLPLLTLVFVYCHLPVDPLQNYDNCTVDITGISDDAVFYIDDIVGFDVTVGNPHLIDTLTVSFGDRDSTISFNQKTQTEESLHFTTSFPVPDTVAITVTALKRNHDRVTSSVTIIILGHEPQIVAQPKNYYMFRPGFACTLSVKAVGSDPLHYQWFKDDNELEGDTLDTLLLPYVQPINSGEYYCKVWNGWGADSSTASSVVVSVETGKTVYWKFGILKDTVSEGETLVIRIKSLYVVPAGDAGTPALLNPASNARFTGDSLFTFTAAARDSGDYGIPVIVSTRGGADTSQIVITVLPRHYTLSLHAVSGSITAQPATDSYRWGDTVTLTAIPDPGFKFSEWSGDATGITSEIKVVIQGNTEITALFITETATGCVELTSGSLNTAIKDASSSSKRPGSLCPAEGLYDNGTIQVWGTVRFIFQ